MPLPECYMIRSPSMTTEQTAESKHFRSLADGMDIPKHQVLNNNYEWIYKYALKRNENHSNIKKLTNFLESVLDPEWLTKKQTA